MLLIFALPAEAQRRGLSLVRDAEIEALVREYARPLMKAANLRPGSVRFNIVNDNSFNAFVSGTSMFINTGLLLRSETPGEAIGVIAHELGHIVGGHQIRLRQRIEDATRIARWSTLLGVGLGAAGAIAGSGDVSRAGLGLAAGGSTIARRSLLQYQRSEESAADRTALTLLNKTKQSGAGMLATFKKMGQDLALVGRQIDPYAVSHPLPSKRLATLGEKVRKSRHFGKKASRSQRERHDMVRAKIAAYTGGDRYARSVLQARSLSPNAQLYGRAIVTYLYGSPRNALPQITALIKRLPKNAYVHEMRGEILLRSGQAAAAAKSFKKAVSLDKTRAGFIRIELGHALLESGGKKSAKFAINELRKGLRRDPTAVAGYQHLARAHALLGNEASALLASAEFSVRTGQKRQARQFAKRAQAGFKRGSPGWLRAGDIINYK